MTLGLVSLCAYRRTVRLVLSGFILIAALGMGAYQESGVQASEEESCRPPEPPRDDLIPSQVDVEESNIRSGPSLDCEIVAELEEGDPIEVWGDPLDANELEWIPARSGATEGWIYVGNVSNIVAMDESGCPAIGGVSSGDSRAFVVSATETNIRTGPSTNCDIVDEMAFGAELVVRGDPIPGDEYQWLPVELEQGLGFIASSNAVPSSQFSGASSIPVLMYHNIDYPADRFQVSPAQLEEQLIWLLNNGYTSVTPSDVIAWLDQGVPLPPRPVILSVDDGWASTHTFVELLSAYGFRGTYMLPNYSELTEDYIRELDRIGEVCGHSVSHQFLAELSWDAQWYEVYENKVWLESIVSHPITCFSYPFGSVSSATVEVVQAAGYQIAFHAWWGPAPLSENLDRWRIERIEVKGTYSLETLVEIMQYPVA